MPGHPVQYVAVSDSFISHSHSPLDSSSFSFLRRRSEATTFSSKYRKTRLEYKKGIFSRSTCLTVLLGFFRSQKSPLKSVQFSYSTHRVPFLMENLRDYTTLYCSICHSFVRVTILVFSQHEILIIHLHPSDEDQAQQKNRLTTEHPLAAKSVCTQ